MKYLIIISIFLVSCNPCKRIAKYEQCFPADTIRIENEVIHYERVYITNDSIIRDTIPCDPITKTYYKTRTVYKTNHKTIVDTIYQFKETSKINPINEVLKKEKEKLSDKNKLKNKVMIGLIIFILLLGVIIKLK
jgi:hypothetical protein